MGFNSGKYKPNQDGRRRARRRFRARREALVKERRHYTEGQARRRFRTRRNVRERRRYNGEKGSNNTGV